MVTGSNTARDLLHLALRFPGAPAVQTVHTCWLLIQSAILLLYLVQ